MRYTSGGYIDMHYIIDSKMPFSFIVGARGTGKTYGALKDVLVDHPRKFIYMRRLQTQIDLIKGNESMNPIGPVSRDCSRNIILHNINKYVVGIYNGMETEDGKTVPIGEPLGYMLALSTISNLRGFDMSQVEVLIFDEFIPEKQESKIKMEGQAFLNAIETIARNRELQGRDPLQVLCLANSNDIANPIFIELGLVTYVEKMLAKGIDYIRMDDKATAVWVCSKAPISKLKKETALYKLSKGTQFSEMALENTFTDMDTEMVRPQDLSHYNAIVKVGELVIYEDKNKHGRYYVSAHAKGSYDEYNTGESDLMRFRRDYFYLWLAYLNKSIIFETFMMQVLFERYNKMR